jgi:drug/metabolite transporter (DMT)-like permease
MRSTTRVSPHLLLIAAATFWGAHWVVARSIVPHVTPMGMAFWRWVAAILAIAPFALPHLLHDRAQLLSSWKTLLYFGLIGTVLYNAIAYVGLQYTTATNALLFQSFTPGLIPVFAYLLYGDRITLRTTLGLSISFLGLLAIVFRLDLAALVAFSFNPGDLWLLANIVLWALYTASLRRMPSGVHPLSLHLAVMLGGMVTGLPAYAIDVASGARMEWTPAVVAGIAYLGVFPSVVCYVLWGKGVAAIGPAKAGAYLHLTPVAGIAMAFAFLGERLELHHAVGFGLILAGVWLAAGKKQA